MKLTMKRAERPLANGTFAILAAFCIITTYACHGADQSGAPKRTQGVAVAPEARDAKRVSFYEVPLVCPAVPEIGCGSMARPLLLELESSGTVAEAWLNRTGTILAVVWTEHSTRSQRAHSIKAAFKSRDWVVKEVTGKPKLEVLEAFRSERGWYHGADVDRLSAEEAGVNAAKWIGRIRQNIVLTDAAAKALQDEFSRTILHKLAGEITREQAKIEMLGACRQQLPAEDLVILEKAFKDELQR